MSDRFGVSIAIDNGVVAVGAFYDDDSGFDSGSAYLFDASTGVQVAKLLASDAVFLEQFGQSIAIANGVGHIDIQGRKSDLWVQGVQDSPGFGQHDLFDRKA